MGCNVESAGQNYVKIDYKKEKTHELFGPNSLKHWVSTYVGNSGSPLLVSRKNTLFAIAIHQGSSTDGKFNRARLITKNLLTDLLLWEK